MLSSKLATQTPTRGWRLPLRSVHAHAHSVVVLGWTGCLVLPLQDLIAEGYSASQTLSQLHSKLVRMDGLTDKQKSTIAERMGVSQCVGMQARQHCTAGPVLLQWSLLHSLLSPLSNPTTTDCG